MIATATASPRILTVTCGCGLSGCPNVCRLSSYQIILVEKEKEPMIDMSFFESAPRYNFRKHEKRRINARPR